MSGFVHKGTMTNILLLIYPISIAVLTLYGCRIMRGKDFNDEHLDIEQTKMLQAVACLCIIVHHITQQITGYGVVYKGPVTLFNYIGFLFTALFFFCSGYGLITSVLSKPDYLKTFLTKRLPSVLIPFWLINIPGVLLLAFGYGIHYDLSGVLSDVFGLTLINGNGWFIIEIVVLYLFFFAIFSLVRNKDVAIVLLSIVTVLLIIYSSMQGHDVAGDEHWFKGEWWYNSTITFVFGMVVARFREGLERVSRRLFCPLLTIVSVLTVLCIYASVYVLKHYGYYLDYAASAQKYGATLTLAVQMISCIVWTVWVLLIGMKVKPGNKVLKYLSGISMELFLIHGYFVNRIFGNVKLSDPVLFAVVILSSIAVTALIAPVIRFAVRKAIALLNPGRIVNDTIESEIAERLRNKRIKIFKIAASAVILVAFALVLYLTLVRYMTAGSEYRQECEALRTADVGDTVYWGRFETDRMRPGKERLEWIVIGRDGSSVRLLSLKGIGGSYYHQRHTEVAWKDCDLRNKLNSPEYTDMFSRFETESVVPVDDDLITLLTVSELYEVFPEAEDRQLSVTAVAESQGTNANKISKLHQWDMKGYDSSWWWLKGESEAITAPIVEIDGTVYEDKKYVNKPGGAVRPVINVDPDR